MNNDESYIVLARKYRPKKLSDLIGQEEVAEIIEGSVKLNRVAHSFLFSGTRGVGKTTIARILAKIVNCNSIDVKSVEPCGKCENCVSIDKESNIDVVEIDAASRTGVSDVREIIENVSYKPVSAKKKVFIIDEVHMLSKAAFNALLKTLEEPPLDVIFIFATTEIEKVPVTILSRCQRFLLKRIDPKLISDHLKLIAKKEGFDLDQQSSNLIAQCSEGSVRDALSILDNVLARGKTINLESVREVLGLLDNTLVLDLFESLCDGDVNSSLEKFNDIYNKGVSIDLLAKTIMNFTYHTARIKSEVDKDFSFLDAESQKKIEKISLKFEMDFIVRFWELMQKYVNEISSFFDEKQCFEMIIMRLCYVALVPTPFEIIKEKKLLEKESDSNQKNDLSIKSKNENFSKKKVLDDFDTNLARQKEPNANIVEKPNNLISGKDSMEKFSKLINLIDDRSEVLISYHLKNSFRLVHFSEPDLNKKIGTIELENIAEKINYKEILWKASKVIEKSTNCRWIFSISNKQGFKSIAEYENEKNNQKIELIKKDKLIKKILEIIPSSEVISINKVKSKESS